MTLDHVSGNPEAAVNRSRKRLGNRSRNYEFSHCGEGFLNRRISNTEQQNVEGKSDRASDDKTGELQLLHHWTFVAISIMLLSQLNLSHGSRSFLRFVFCQNDR